jgi:hypothetical protein
MTGYTLATKFAIELPFQNRDAEIETIARTCLENLKLVKLVHSEESQKKTTLLTSAQMWGSGKSWLGNHFLEQFNSPQCETLRSKLAEEFGTEDVHTLAHSIYLLVDLRRWSDLLPRRAVQLDEYVLCSLVGAMLMHFPDDCTFWESQPIANWTPKGVLAWFTKKYHKTFFVHFDEVDLILNVAPSLTRDEIIGIEAAKRFYDFWRLTHPIILTGNFLYVSGRSVFLYSYGKGLYRNYAFKSPGISLQK